MRPQIKKIVKDDWDNELIDFDSNVDDFLDETTKVYMVKTRTSLYREHHHSTNAQVVVVEEGEASKSIHLLL